MKPKRKTVKAKTVKLKPFKPEQWWAALYIPGNDIGTVKWRRCWVEDFITKLPQHCQEDYKIIPVHITPYKAKGGK